MITKRLLLIATILLSLYIKAQPGALDESFYTSGIGPNTPGYILTTDIQQDGKIIIGGLYHLYNGIPSKNISRLNTDGTLDTSFVVRSDSTYTIYKILVQPDDKILVSGYFTQFDTVISLFLARLNPNGSVDTTFKTGAGFNDLVREIALQPDGKIMVGGWFTDYNGTTVGRICRLNSDGSIDSTFNSFVGASGGVEAIVIQPDGKILFGGDFQYYNGTWNIRMARAFPNGNIDSSFVSFPGASHVVYDLALQPSGKVIAGGNFQTYDFQNKTRILRLNADMNGSIDVLFSNLLQPDREVNVIKTLNNGSILIGGAFTTIKNAATGCLVKVDSSGVVDTIFNTKIGANFGVRSISVQDDGKIIIAGFFTEYNGSVSNKIARLYNCLTPQPDSIFGLAYAECKGTAQTYRVNPVAGATRYEWTLPGGWTGSSDSASITAVSDGSGGTITVKAFTPQCGYSYAAKLSVSTPQIPGIDICLVTVDSQSTHNIIVWEKQPTNLIDSFCIYRETTNNVYTKIASLPYDSLSEYHDYAANPNITSYRYKLTTVDTCGVESNLSVFHNTIHLQYLGMGNFQWTFYQIQPGINPVISFNVYRDNFNNGNFSQIGFVSGSNATFTDVSYSSFPNANYVVDVNWGIACTPSRAVNTTRSNKRPLIDLIWLSVDDESNNSISISPNPVKGSFRVRHGEDVKILQLEMFNSLGQKVLIETNAESISVENLPKGIYVLALQTNVGRIVKKVVVE